MTKTAAQTAPMQKHEARGHFDTAADLSASLDALLTRATEPDYRLIETGIASLDRDLTISPGDVTAVLGRPGMGKSLLCKAIAKRELARIAQRRTLQHDTTDAVVYVTLEEPREKLTLQLAGDMPFTWRQLKRAEVQDTEGNRLAIAGATKKLRDLFVIRHPGLVDGRISRPLSSERVMSVIEQIASDHGRRVTLVVLDYLQLLHGEGMPYTARSKTDHVMAASAGAVRLARGLDAAVVLAVQAARETDKRSIPLPGLTDGQWASSIEQDVDSMIGLARPLAVEAIREQVAADGYMDLQIGDRSLRLDEKTGRSLMVLGVPKARNDANTGRRYAAHVDPERLAVHDIDWTRQG